MIIGGGLTGASCAFWINKLIPGQKTLLLEANELAFGASGRNAGFLTHGSVAHFSRLINRHGLSTALKIWKISDENIHLLKTEVLDTAPFAVNLHGSLSLCTSKIEWESLQKKRSSLTIRI